MSRFEDWNQGGDWDWPVEQNAREIRQFVYDAVCSELMPSYDDPEYQTVSSDWVEEEARRIAEHVGMQFDAVAEVEQ